MRTRQIISRNNAMNNVARQVTQPTISTINQNFDGTKHKLLKFGYGGCNGVKAPLTFAVQQDLPHFFVLDQEEKGVKFNKGITIKGKAMNGYSYEWKEHATLY
jgi:hypothetical protein